LWRLIAVIRRSHDCTPSPCAENTADGLEETHVLFLWCLLLLLMMSVVAVAVAVAVIVIAIVVGVVVVHLLEDLAGCLLTVVELTIIC
jgi:hypothetical protein